MAPSIHVERWPAKFLFIIPPENAKCPAAGFLENFPPVLDIPRFVLGTIEGVKSEKLKPRSAQSGKAKRRYPWGLWLSGGTFALRRGEDFLGRTDTFVQQVRNRARLEGIGVSLAVSEDGHAVAMTARRKRAKKDG